MNSCLSGTTCDGADAELMLNPLFHCEFALLFHCVPVHPGCVDGFCSHYFCLVFEIILQKVDISCIIFCLGIEVYSVIMAR